MEKNGNYQKKKENIYEYIYTSSKKNRNICDIVPVSRSYFKIHEIIKIFNIYDKNLSCACIAEGPGGFIHCLNDNNSSRIYGITLLCKDNKKVPFWNQLIISNKNNKLSNGSDNTGDIYHIDNVNYFIKEIGEDLCNLITADGGFDYSNDYNSQENMSYKLLYCEIFTALNIQKVGGNFVIKFFDLFNINTMKLIYILYNCYNTIEIYKPSTSRLSNSEKYIICKGLIDIPIKIINIMKEYYENPEKILINIPKSFIDEITHYNQRFAEKQVQIINTIITNINKNNIEKPTKEQIVVAKRWCELYGLPLNKTCIFL